MPRSSPRKRAKRAQDLLAWELGYAPHPNKRPSIPKNPIRCKLLKLFAEQGKQSSRGTLSWMEPAKNESTKLGSTTKCKQVARGTPLGNGTPSDWMGESGLPPTGSVTWSGLGQARPSTTVDVDEAKRLHHWLKSIGKGRGARADRLRRSTRAFLSGLSYVGANASCRMGVLPGWIGGVWRMSMAVWSSGWDPGRLGRFAGWWGLDGELIPWPPKKLRDSNPFTIN